MISNTESMHPPLVNTLALEKEEKEKVWALRLRPALQKDGGETMLMGGKRMLVTRSRIEHSFILENNKKAQIMIMSNSRKACRPSLTAHNQSSIGKQNYKVFSSKSSKNKNGNFKILIYWQQTREHNLQVNRARWVKHCRCHGNGCHGRPHSCHTVWLFS